MEQIRSRANSYIKSLAALNKKGNKSPVIVIEGKKIIGEALSSGTPIETVLVSESFKDDVFLKKLYSDQIRLIGVSDDIIEHICDTKTPQGIAAVIKKRYFELNNHDILKKGFYIILEGVSDPGNVGTIIRSSGAFFIDGLFLCAGCADIYNQKVVRATAGEIFKNNIYKEPDIGRVIDILKSHDIKIYGAALSPGGIELGDKQLDFKEGCAVIIGSEGGGISQDTLKLCDYTLKIPMSDRTESLNASVAGSIIMWEAFKQRKLQLF